METARSAIPGASCWLLSQVTPSRFSPPTRPQLPQAKRNSKVLPVPAQTLSSQAPRISCAALNSAGDWGGSEKKKAGASRSSGKGDDQMEDFEEPLKVGRVNPVARKEASMESTIEELQELREELKDARAKVALSEARVEHTLDRLAELQKQVERTAGNSASDMTATTSTNGLDDPQSISGGSDTVVKNSPKSASKNRGVRPERVMYSQVDTSSRSSVDRGVLRPGEKLRDFWYPAAFTSKLDSKTMIPFECFGEPWVLFRGADGRVGCIRDECAHRACPLSLGVVVDNRVQCAYHGWEYSTSGHCEKMPSTVQGRARVASLPCVEQDGFVWIFPGSATPPAELPSLLAPAGFAIHAELVIDVAVEHGLLMENLLDLAHAPFTHTSTFARGWKIPDLVNFKTAASQALSGAWDPYPIDMSFQPPCMVLSTIGLAQPGKLEGSVASECDKHLHQLHVCMPAGEGKTRLLYRMSLDFAQWAQRLPFMESVWMHMANQVLSEDLRLVEGQQNRMMRGANVWNHPVPYDKLGVRYRRWRDAIENGKPATTS